MDSDQVKEVKMAPSKRQKTFSDSESPPFVIKTVEMHTGGEPVRIITEGYPKIQGKTILEKRAYVRDHLDVFRKRLLWEPRGHYDMYGALLVEPDDKTADIGVLFMHNNGYGTMCGHACIGLGRYVVDKGIVPAKSPETELVIQCPTGPVKVWVDYQDGRSGRARFHSVPAFVFALDQEVDVPNYGRVKVDIASGGAFYAFLPDSSLGLDLRTAPIETVRSAAIAVTEAVRKAVKLRHPEHPDMAYLDGTIITDGRDEYDETPTVHTSVFGGTFVDRSPCGSGTTARVAILHRRGQLDLSKARQFASGPTGSVMTGRPVRETRWGEFDAVIVEVAGNAYYTGTAEFTVEPDDPLKDGFLVK
ncbi:trans-L-3-hydroxyproline dehydratase-like [Branchiostoma floridae]|uniref:trans-L-3-hydroxyproline dehydratase n=2 Tax=Branchiostoma floridae TaxID=7739 RepID=A0A9J7HQ03_BRAFL|nr:trans-L-3-hydroxyproline dehydratase-like [Branchiostoma floridae]